MDLMLVNMNNDIYIFPLTFTNILSEVLSLCYLVHLETLAVIEICVWQINLKEKKTGETIIEIRSWISNC